ncbi:MAG TPA: GLUG motif-containing protein [Rhizomicrobium sp.]|jgi:hypothetical protein|nr:GLUG motif-containing protein [Rhizomicrobium sp.]
MPRFARLLAFAIPLASSAIGARADVVISSGQTQNVACSNGACVPTAPKAVLNVDDLQTMLASGNVRITTLGVGVQAKDIHVKSTFRWSTSYTLSLDAYHSIVMDAPILSTASSSGLSLTTNDGAADGLLVFGTKGNITFGDFASTLVINGISYQLVTSSFDALVQNINENPAGNYALAASLEAGSQRPGVKSPIKVLKGRLEGLGNQIEGFSIDARNANHGIGMIATSYGTISDLHLTGTITVHKGDGPEGLLVATNYGSIFGSSATVSINGGAYAEVGGLVGESMGGSIGYSSATGSLNAGYACY